MVTKKAPAKKAPSIKTTGKTTRKVATVKKPVPMRSFRVAPEVKPFVTVGLTRQTVYWSILLLFVIAMQLWIVKIQMDIITLTNSIMMQ